MIDKMGVNIVAIITGSVGPELTQEHVLEAIARYDAGAEHAFGKSLRHDLWYEGRPYPPKAIFALAAEQVLGRPVERQELSSNEQLRGYLRDLKFKVSERSKMEPTSLGADDQATRLRVWVIALGHGGSELQRCIDEGVICIGWDNLGDLSQYEDEQAIRDRLAADSDRSPVNNTRSVFGFARVMAPGDLVLVKKGLSRIEGLARVTGGYRFDAEADRFKHVRAVEWLRFEPLQVPDSMKLPMKTLTPLSPHRHRPLLEYVQQHYGVGLIVEDELAERLAEQWSRFQEDPVHRLRLAVRLNRAVAFQRHLADWARQGFEVFNREAWSFESQTLLDGEEITGEIWDDDLTGERATEIHRALDEGRLQLHGNHTWRSGSHMYGPSLDNIQRAEQLNRLAAAVEEGTVDPLGRAKSMIDIKGFGANTATGLCMLLHPEDIAIQNQPSQAALTRLGYAFKGLEQFQEAAAELRDNLEVDDFVALDYLLYFAEVGPATCPEPDPTQKQAWLFQCNPKVYSYTEHIDELRQSRRDRWPITRYGQEVKQGDRVLIWEAGADAGFVAMGEVVADPSVQRPVAETRDVRGDAEELGVDLRLTDFFDPKISRESLADHPVLSQMQVLRAPQGTNFRITEVEWAALKQLLDDRVVGLDEYREPAFEEIEFAVSASKLRIPPSLLRRYHLSLRTRGFVVLSGISGTGKTRLAEEYARAVGAERCVVAVAPNWNTNEDLLGFFNPLDDRYAHTEFSRFLERAEKAYNQAQLQGLVARPYHLILDEMNLARVEHYFAKFLSAMERRRMDFCPPLDLGGDRTAMLPPNLKFIGTVNINETTHGFAQKVYDRAQVIELDIDEDRLLAHLADQPYAALLAEIWRTCSDVAPFAFRILDEVEVYVREAEQIGLDWQEALDHVVLQKVLPKISGAEHRCGETLVKLLTVLEADCPLSHRKASWMYRNFQEHGFVSYF